MEHKTETTASSSNCLGKAINYVKTQKGLILASETIISFIIAICYMASWYGGYLAGAISEMIFAGVIFVVFMMEWDKQFREVNWLWTDFLRAGTGAGAYIVISLVCVSRSYGDTAQITAGVLGLIAGFLFAYDTYTIYLQIKETRQTQYIIPETKADGTFK